MSKFCTHCGTQLNDNIKFCPNCGTATAAPAQAEQPTQQPTYTQPTAQPNYTQSFGSSVYAGNGAVRNGIPAPGFSDRVNHPEILAAVKKNRKAARVFTFFLVPFPVIGAVLYALVSKKRISVRRR